MDPTLLASTIAGANGDIEAAFTHLADKLATSFPDHTTVETSGLLSKKLELLEVKLDPHVYRMRRDGKHVVAERAKVVRGVALKTSKLDFADWLRELSQDLTAMAKSTAASRAALARWVRGE